MDLSSRALPDNILALKALRWWRCSGARARRARENVPYDTWCIDPSNDTLIAGDLEQIDKDVTGGRTDANVFMDEHLRLICQSCTRLRLRRVLVAFVRRLPRPGYAQGMNMVCALLMAVFDALWRMREKKERAATCESCKGDVKHQGVGVAAAAGVKLMTKRAWLCSAKSADEAAFWCLLAFVLDLRGADYYSAPPASMNGLMAEAAAMGGLLGERWPQLAAKVGAGGTHTMAQMIAPKLLVTATIDAAALEVTLEVWDELMGGGEGAGADAMSESRQRSACTGGVARSISAPLRAAVILAGLSVVDDDLGISSEFAHAVAAARAAGGDCGLAAAGFVLQRLSSISIQRFLAASRNSCASNISDVDELSGGDDGASSSAVDSSDKDTVETVVAAEQVQWAQRCALQPHRVLGAVRGARRGLSACWAGGRFVDGVGDGECDLRLSSDDAARTSDRLLLRLARATHFTQPELKRLQRHFRSLARASDADDVGRLSGATAREGGALTGSTSNPGDYTIGRRQFVWLALKIAPCIPPDLADDIYVSVSDECAGIMIHDHCLPFRNGYEDVKASYTSARLDFRSTSEIISSLRRGTVRERAALLVRAASCGSSSAGCGFIDAVGLRRICRQLERLLELADPGVVATAAGSANPRHSGDECLHPNAEVIRRRILRLASELRPDAFTISTARGSEVSVSVPETHVDSGPAAAQIDTAVGMDTARSPSPQNVSAIPLTAAGGWIPAALFLQCAEHDPLLRVCLRFEALETSAIARTPRGSASLECEPGELYSFSARSWWGGSNGDHADDDRGGDDEWWAWTLSTNASSPSRSPIPGSLRANASNDGQAADAKVVRVEGKSEDEISEQEEISTKLARRLTRVVDGMELIASQDTSNWGSGASIGDRSSWWARQQHVVASNAGAMPQSASKVQRPHGPSAGDEESWWDELHFNFGELWAGGETSAIGRLVSADAVSVAAVAAAASTRAFDRAEANGDLAMFYGSDLGEASQTDTDEEADSSESPEPSPRRRRIRLVSLIALRARGLQEVQIFGRMDPFVCARLTRSRPEFASISGNGADKEVCVDDGTQGVGKTGSLASINDKIDNHATKEECGKHETTETTVSVEGKDDGACDGSDCHASENDSDGDDDDASDSDDGDARTVAVPEGGTDPIWVPDLLGRRPITSDGAPSASADGSFDPACNNESNVDCFERRLSATVLLEARAQELDAPLPSPHSVRGGMHRLLSRALAQATSAQSGQCAGAYARASSCHGVSSASMRRKVLLVTVRNENVLLDDDIGRCWIDLADFESDSSVAPEPGVQPALLGRRGWYALDTGGEIECIITVSSV